MHQVGRPFEECAKSAHRLHTRIRGASDMRGHGRVCVYSRGAGVRDVPVSGLVRKTYTFPILGLEPRYPA
eukprot:15334858-Ditylum_brightwellii.AAC.1